MAPSPPPDPETWLRAPGLSADPRPGTRILAETALGALGIELLSCGATAVTARLTPASGRPTLAGELLVLAETAASTAAGLAAGTGRRAFGAELDASFVARPAAGPVHVTATPLALEHDLHRWRVHAVDTAGTTVLEGRCTLAIAGVPS